MRLESYWGWDEVAVDTGTSQLAGPTEVIDELSAAEDGEQPYESTVNSLYEFVSSCRKVHI